MISRFTINSSQNRTELKLKISRGKQISEGLAGSSLDGSDLIKHVVAHFLCQTQPTSLGIKGVLISVPPDVAIDPGRYGGVYQALVIQLESLHQPGMLAQHVLLVVILCVVEGFGWKDLGGDVGTVLCLGRLH